MNKQEMWEEYVLMCKERGKKPVAFEIVECKGKRPTKKMFSDWIDDYERLKEEK